jgi:Holliday junction resolvase
MRRAAKVDRNQPEIVAALRRIGFAVQPMHAVGAGFPDLCAARWGVNYLIEVKDGLAVPSAQKLTPRQVEWHAEWTGQVCVLTSVDDVIAWAAALPMNGE